MIKLLHFLFIYILGLYIHFGNSSLATFSVFNLFDGSILANGFGNEANIEIRLPIAPTDRIIYGLVAFHTGGAYET